jgi:hypothetical protein
MLTIQYIATIGNVSGEEMVGLGGESHRGWNNGIIVSAKFSLPYSDE